MRPDIIVPICGMLMVITIVLGVPLIRSYSKRLDAKPREALPNGDTTARLERIEQAIDAMATEVERVAEGQRFTTKLLSEVRATAPAAIAAPATPAQAPVPSGMQPDGTVLSQAARRS